MPLLIDRELPKVRDRVASLCAQALALALRLGVPREGAGAPATTRSPFPRADVKALERSLRGCASIEEGVERLVARGALPLEGIEAEGRYFLVEPGGRRSLDVARYAGRMRTFDGFSGAPLPASLPDLARYALDPSALVTAEQLAQESAARFESLIERPRSPVVVLHMSGRPRSKSGVEWGYDDRLAWLDGLLGDANRDVADVLAALDLRLLREFGRADPLPPLLRRAVAFAAARCGDRVVPRSPFDVRFSHGHVGAPWAAVPDPYDPLLAAAELGFAPLWFTHPARDGRSCMGLWRLP